MQAENSNRVTAKHSSRVFEFEYNLIGAGWAKARIADDKRHADLSASYLSDALRSLVEAVALIIEGQTEARCSWEEEPGEFRWIFRRQADALSVQILVFDDVWGDEPDDTGREVFSTLQDPARVGHVILSAAQRVVDDLGETEYGNQWIEHPFPKDAVERLRVALQAA